MSNQKIKQISLPIGEKEIVYDIAVDWENIDGKEDIDFAILLYQCFLNQSLKRLFHLGANSNSVILDIRNHECRKVIYIRLNFLNILNHEQHF